MIRAGYGNLLSCFGGPDAKVYDGLINLEVFVLHSILGYTSLSRVKVRYIYLYFKPKDMSTLLLIF